MLWMRFVLGLDMSTTQREERGHVFSFFYFILFYFLIIYYLLFIVYYLLLIVYFIVLKVN